MDPKSAHPGMLFAPASGSSAALRFSSAREFPPVDEHIVKPETREEMVRGRRMLAMPANPEHGDRHFELDYVIRAYVKEGYVGSTDLLTRASASSNFATDTCVRKKGDDPRTGRRYLEELAFEVVNEQSLSDMTERAEDLTARGVRRMVAIFVKKGEVCEWSPQTGAWNKLDLASTFSDPTLARPLEVSELLDAAGADNAVARALLAKNIPVLVEAKAESRKQGLDAGRVEGQQDGLRLGIEAACELLGIDLDPPRRARLDALDAAGLTALLGQLRADRRWP